MRFQSLDFLLQRFSTVESFHSRALRNSLRFYNLCVSFSSSTPHPTFILSILPFIAKAKCADHTLLYFCQKLLSPPSDFSRDIISFFPSARRPSVKILPTVPEDIHEDLVLVLDVDTPRRTRQAISYTHLRVGNSLVGVSVGVGVGALARVHLSPARCSLPLCLFHKLFLNCRPDTLDPSCRRDRGAQSATHLERRGIA